MLMLADEQDVRDLYWDPLESKCICTTIELERTKLKPSNTRQCVSGDPFFVYQ